MIIGKSKLEVRLNKLLEEHEQVFKYDYNQYLTATRYYDDEDEDTLYIIIEDEDILEQGRAEINYQGSMDYYIQYMVYLRMKIQQLIKRYKALNTKCVEEKRNRYVTHILKNAVEIIDCRNLWLLFYEYEKEQIQNELRIYGKRVYDIFEMLKYRYDKEVYTKFASILNIDLNKVDERDMKVSLGELLIFENIENQGHVRYVRGLDENMPLTTCLRYVYR